MGEWATDELEQCKARIAALEQHVSELEKSLENARKERDEMLEQVAESTRLAEERLAERNATQAELDAALARLQPSGQVAEDVKVLEDVFWDDGESQPWMVALSRIAAKAQGYEAAMAERDVARAMLAEREALLAGAREREATHEAAIRQAVSERDTAVADNVKLVKWINEHGHRIGDRLCPYTGGYACQTGCEAHAIHVQPHPGAALLEKHREELAAAARRHETTRATMQVREEEHRKALEPLQAIVDGLASEMERTLRHRERKGGMSVPDHGDFCNAPPSMLGRLRWWAREMREALAGRTSALLVRARNEGLEMARETMRKALPERGLISSGQVSRALSEIDALKEPEGGQS